MVTRAQLSELQQANDMIADLVDREVADLFVMIGGSSPEEAESILHQVLPELVNEYGQIAQTTAAEWYESTYGARAAVLAAGTPASAVHSNIGYQASQQGLDDIHAWVSGIQSSAVRHVHNQGRNLIMTSAQLNGGYWARVPRGEFTCAFCLMLASRDAVYISEETALSASRTGSEYHNDCDCEAVQINSWDDYPEGYQPDKYYQIYTDAVHEVGNRSDYSSITAQIRRLHPDIVTDGVR